MKWLSHFAVHSWLRATLIFLHIVEVWDLVLCFLCSRNRSLFNIWNERIVKRRFFLYWHAWNQLQVDCLANYNHHNDWNNHELAFSFSLVYLDESNFTAAYRTKSECELLQAIITIDEQLSIVWWSEAFSRVLGKSIFDKVLFNNFFSCHLILLFIWKIMLSTA